jgi:hypothetical protein
MNKLMENTNLIRNALITVYVLVVLGFSATAKAQMSILPVFPNTNQHVQIQSYVGQVAMTTEGDFYLVVTEDTVFQLQSNLDLSQFNGSMVSVDGYEIKHKVKPVVELASLDPLSGSRDEATVAPLLVVFGISEISQ